MRAAGLQCFKGSVCRQHAALDGGMAAFDARCVQVAGIAANECAARKHGLGQGLRCAVVDGARAVADALAAFEVSADGRVGFPALHFLERAHPRVLVVQPKHKAQGHLVAFEVVQKAAAKAAVGYRPAAGVHHQAGLGFGRVHFPQFLDANSVGLRVFAGVELVLGNQLFAQVAARAFGKNGVLGMQFHAQLKAVGRLAVFANS